MVFEISSKDELERGLLNAHAQDNRVLLAELYVEAADRCENAGDIEGTCFYLTHALVFALQEGLADAPTIQTRLHDYGREYLRS